MVDNFDNVFASSIGRLTLLHLFLKFLVLLLLDDCILLLDQFLLELIQLFDLHLYLGPNFNLLGVLVLLRQSSFHEIQVVSRAYREIVLLLFRFGLGFWPLFRRRLGSARVRGVSVKWLIIISIVVRQTNSELPYALTTAVIFSIISLNLFLPILSFLRIYLCRRGE